MNIPKHIGIIIDGNRRWAKERNMPTLEGHRQGYNIVKKIGKYALNKGIKVITFWCFSTENWKRTKQEVNYLMQLLADAFIQKEIEQYHKKGIKIQVMGQKEKLSPIIQKRIEQAEQLTKNNQKGILNLAISYGGKAELISAIKNIINEEIPENEITEQVINQHLWTKNLPEPELIIRTGGHKRLSGFLPWQSGYSELYFLDKYWPDFNENDLDEAINYYSQCQRNFGK